MEWSFKEFTAPTEIFGFYLHFTKSWWISGVKSSYRNSFSRLGIKYLGLSTVSEFVNLSDL